LLNVDEPWMVSGSLRAAGAAAANWADSAIAQINQRANH
jgi:hypothetical protein